MREARERGELKGSEGNGGDFEGRGEGEVGKSMATVCDGKEEMERD